MASNKVVSPGVFSNEIDASFLPATIGDIGAVVIGPTVKGPVLQPTVITSYGEFTSKFGATFKSGSSYYQYLTSHAVENYLRNASTCTVVRVAGGGFSATVDYLIVAGGGSGGGLASTSSSGGGGGAGGDGSGVTGGGGDANKGSGGGGGGQNASGGAGGKGVIIFRVKFQ